MWIANGIAGVCNAGAGIFDAIESNFAGVPLIGSTLAAPFGYFGDRLSEAKGFFYDLGDWGDDVIGDISAIFGEIAGLVGGVLDFDDWKHLAQKWIDKLLAGAADFGGKVTDVLGSTWTDMKNLVGNFGGAVFDVLGDAWGNLVWLYDNFRELVVDVIEGAVMSFTYAGKFIQGTVVGFVSEIYINANDLFENFVDYVHAGVVNWSEAQYEEVVAIVFGVIPKYFDTFEDSITAILVKGFEVIERQWSILEDSFLWLGFKVIGVIADQAEAFSDKIWDMVEKIIEKI